jgi:bacillithiol biosynthesis deacetylase BshB1
MKLDILAIAAHPDDIELCCAGTLLRHMAMGRKVGIIDLTSGELGTRGSGPLRLEEAQASAKVLGIDVRENLMLPDGFFENNRESQLKVARIIRKYQPEIVITNAVHDRHPDHAKGAKLVTDACFFAGLPKVETELDGVQQSVWRPKQIYHIIQDYRLTPDFCVDVTPYMEKRMEAIKCFSSQFYDPNSDEPESPLTGQDFFDLIYGIARSYGRMIGCEFGEGFTVQRQIGIRNLFDVD